MPVKLDHTIVTAQRSNGRAIYFADPSGHWLEVLTRS